MASFSKSLDILSQKTYIYVTVIKMLLLVTVTVIKMLLLVTVTVIYVEKI